MLHNIYFHFGGDNWVECHWAAVPRIGETVILHGAFTVVDVRWEAGESLDVVQIRVQLVPKLEKSP
jgi:hypothetical protein